MAAATPIMADTKARVTPVTYWSMPTKKNDHGCYYADDKAEPTEALIDL
jgi:hypothetical protein